MRRLRARAPRGERAYGRVPRNRGKTTTLLASMGARRGWGRAWRCSGQHDQGGLRSLYVEAGPGAVLAAPRAGRVVLDNLGAHKGERARELIEERGAEVLFLPPYSSPDFSPIEEAFSKLKALWLGKAAARTREALVEAIGRALDAVTALDARGWFAHCGYPLSAQPS
jgi:transposase